MTGAMLQPQLMIIGRIVWLVNAGQVIGTDFASAQKRYRVLSQQPQPTNTFTQQEGPPTLTTSSTNATYRNRPTTRALLHSMMRSQKMRDAVDTHGSDLARRSVISQTTSVTVRTPTAGTQATSAFRESY
jgi:hypothetical protein